MKIISDKVSWSVMKYCFKIISKSRISLLAIFLVVLVSVSPILFKVFLNSELSFKMNYYANQYLFLMILPIYLIILTSIFSFTLFSKTKTNNIDLYLSMNEIGKVGVFISKQMSILFIQFIIMTTSLAISTIIMSFIGLPILTILMFVISVFIWSLISQVIWIFICSSMLSIVKSVWTGIGVNVLVSTVILTSSVVPIIVSKNTNITYDTKNQFYKLLNFSDDGAIKSKENVYLGDEYMKKWNDNISKFNIFNGLFGGLFTMSNIGMKLSSTERQALFNHLNYKSVISENISYIPISGLHIGDSSVIVPINEESPYEMKDKISFNKTLFSKVSKALDGIVDIKGSDDKYLNTLLSTLKTSYSYSNSNLSDKDIKILSNALGVNDDYLSIIFRDSRRLNTQLNNFYTYAQEHKMSKMVVNILEYLWTNDNVKYNVYRLGLLDIDKKLFKGIKNINKYKKANLIDIDFIKHIYFHYDDKNDKLKMLNDKMVYVEIPDYITVLNIKTLKSSIKWDEYIDDNNTINNLSSIIQKSSASIGNSKPNFNFMPNSINKYNINNIYSIDVGNKYVLTWCYLIGFIAISIFIQYHAIAKLKRKDVL